MSDFSKVRKILCGIHVLPQPKHRGALIGAELGAKLGVMDIDGSAPKSYRYELGGPSELHATLTS